MHQNPPRVRFVFAHEAGAIDFYVAVVDEQMLGFHGAHGSRSSKSQMSASCGHTLYYVNHSFEISRVLQWLSV
jgi:hypothetical protein